MARLNLQGGEYDDDFDNEVVGYNNQNQQPYSNQSQIPQQNNFNNGFNVGINANSPYGIPNNGSNMGEYQLYGQQGIINPNNIQNNSQPLNNENINSNIPKRTFENAYQSMYGESIEHSSDNVGYSFNSGNNKYNTMSEDNKIEYNNMIINRKKAKVNKPLLITIALIFSYIGFLIVGITGTTYQDDNGTKKAVVATLEDRKAREDYETLKVYYLDMVTMLNTTNDYEHQMETKMTSYFTLATNYEDVLTVIDSRITKVKSLAINERYTTLKVQESEAYNYIALYCQKMQTALVNDDYDSYMEAISWKETAQYTLENIRNNLIAMGENDAKIFNDETLSTSIYSNSQNNDNTNTTTQNEELSTGNYGQNEDETIISITTESSGLGQGRNGNKGTTTSDNNINETQINENIDNQNNNDNEESLPYDDGNISIENPYK